MDKFMRFGACNSDIRQSFLNQLNSINTNSWSKEARKEIEDAIEKIKKDTTPRANW
jgi:hypothetical protein